MNITNLEQELAQFTGTEHMYIYNQQIQLTDGVKYLCEVAKCYWIIDIIWSYQSIAKVRKESFQVYNLEVYKKFKDACMKCDDGNGNILHQQEIEYTTFPLPEIQLYFIDGIVMLPSEY